MEWRIKAACRGLDPNTFFPAEGDIRTFRKAQAVCAGCPVLSECRAYAIAAREEFGVWGGLGARERERAAQRAKMLGRRSLGRMKAIEAAAQMSATGATARQIASTLEIEKRTVCRYLADARKLGLLAA